MEFQEEGIQNPPLLSEVRQDDGDDDLHWDSHDYAILDKEEVAVEEDELEEDEEEEEEEDDDGGVADDLDGIVCTDPTYAATWCALALRAHMKQIREEDEDFRKRSSQCSKNRLCNESQKVHHHQVSISGEEVKINPVRA
ncbi:hypothetical protein RDABS01_024778 [Bienertia sinuspersici]